MKKIELDFDRPRALQADGPPERRGLERDEVRLLVTTERGHEHARFRDLPRFLAPGTLLVVNTSATLPASLPARHAGLGPLLANVSTQYGGGLYLVELRRSAAEPGPLPRGGGRRFWRSPGCPPASSRPIRACRGSGSSASRAISGGPWNGRARRSATAISKRPTRRSRRIRPSSRACRAAPRCRPRRGPSRRGSWTLSGPRGSTWPA